MSDAPPVRECEANGICHEPARWLWDTVERGRFLLCERHKKDAEENPPWFGAFTRIMSIEGE